LYDCEAFRRQNRSRNSVAAHRFAGSKNGLDQAVVCTGAMPRSTVLCIGCGRATTRSFRSAFAAKAP